MSLDTDAFERLQQMLADLEPHIKDMTGKSPQFVRDQLERVERYGINVHVSPAQRTWLEDLHKKHCGGDEKIVDEATRDEILGDDMDDEIPF